MLIGRVLSQRALITPDRIALIYEGRHFSYQELNRRTNRLAQALIAAGIKPGERVAALLNNCHEFVEAYFAASKIGAIFVPLNIRLAPSELDYMLQDCEASLLFYGVTFGDKVGKMNYASTMPRIVIGPGDGRDQNYEDFLAKGSETEPGLAIEETAINTVMYTSGTTGFPKGAMLTHENVYSGAVDLRISLDFRHPEKCLMLAPLFHSGASTPLVAHVIAGVTCVIMEKFRPEPALQLIQDEQITFLLGVTTIMKMLLEVENLEQYRLDSFKTAFLPGSPLKLSLIQEAYQRIGVRCKNMWGLTEICGPGAIMPDEYILKKPESAGKPYFNVDLRIVDAQGRDAAPGDLGEIVIRCPHLMKGYWNRPKATAQTIIDGWLYSGDMGFIDGEGFLYVVDRIKDMIISGGENIYPAEVEKVILEMAGISDAAVVGRQDDKWGEVVVAFVEAPKNGGPDESGIIAHCREKLAGYKVPKQAYFLDELPKTPSGKILKKDLRDRLKKS